MALPPFSEIARYRAEFNGLRTIRVTHDLIGRRGKVADVLARHLAQLGHTHPFKVLDIGAYDRAFGRALESMRLPCTYYSLDVDNPTAHDFNRLDDVSGIFDVIGMFEVIEHLAYEEVDELLHKAYNLLAPAGRLFISTPNPFHPTRYFSDASHKQHWPAHDLYALLRHVGFQGELIEMYGIVYAPVGLLQRALAGTRDVIWHAIGIDRRGGLLAVAIKGRPAVNPL
jgi:SAM-dependent methyltransferase